MMMIIISIADEEIVAVITDAMHELTLKNP